jgi:hypothetical protein
MKYSAWFIVKGFFNGTLCEQCNRARAGVKSVRAIAPHRAPNLLGTKTAVNGIIVLSIDW